MNRLHTRVVTQIAAVALLATMTAYGQSDVIHDQSPEDSQRSRFDFHSAPHVRAFAKEDIAKVRTVATADVDKKDGPDIVTAQANGMLNVLQNNGTGKLRNAYSNNSAVALDPDVTYIETSDLNLDGYPDVVAADIKNSAFLVFLNKGDGTFADAVSIPVGSVGGATLAGGGLSVADANGDDKPDVITIARAATPVSTAFSQTTFLGKGDGTFEPLASQDTSLSGSFALYPGRSVSLADMNGDKKLDMVIQLGQSSPAAAIVIAVSAGAGDGTFERIPDTGQAVNAGPQPASSLLLADLNGDERQDAVLIAFSDSVYVALGQVDGTLGKPEPILTNMTGAVLPVLADVNQDGAQDLVVFGTGELGVFAGKGDGSFQPVAQYTSGYGLFQQPAPADFNGDGILDVASLDYTNGRIGLYQGIGDGTFVASSVVYPDASVWASNLQVITVADLNGDGKQDVLTYRWEHASAGGTADLYAGINDGSGSYTFQLALPKGRLQELASMYNAFSFDNKTADFNGDLRADLILRTQSGLAILLANEDGSFNPDPIDVSFPEPVSCMPFSYLTTGDVNGDGMQDIVAGYMQNTNCGPSASTPSGLFVLLGKGAGHFDAKFTPFADGIFFVRLADLNSDGNQDLLAAGLVPGRGFNLYALAGKGDGSFDVAAARMLLNGQFISDILPVDYNADGKQDIVLPTAGEVGSDGSAIRETAGVLLLPGNGDFTFGSPTKVLDGVSTIWNGVASGDFDGDQKPDLAIITSSQAEPHASPFGLIFVPNNGDGTFGGPQSELMSLNVPGQNHVVFVTDVNSDGAADVITGSGRAGSIFLNMRTQ